MFLTSGLFEICCWLRPNLQDAGHDAQCNASKWDLLSSMWVFTLHTSNIKGKTFQFACASCGASCVSWALRHGTVVVRCVHFVGTEVGRNLTWITETDADIALFAWYVRNKGRVLLLYCLSQATLRVFLVAANTGSLRFIGTGLIRNWGESNLLTQIKICLNWIMHAQIKICLNWTFIWFCLFGLSVAHLYPCKMQTFRNWRTTQQSSWMIRKNGLMCFGHF